MDKLDVLLSTWLHTQPLLQVATIHRWMVIAADNDLVKGAPLVGFMWYFWFQEGLEKQNRPRIIIGGFGALVAAAASRTLAFLFPFRPRPLDVPYLHFDVPGDAFEIKGGSFPSDHAALAFAMVACIYLISPRIGILLGIYALAFIGFPRLYLGIHWPTDILGGAILGVLIVFVLNRDRVRNALARPVLNWHDNFRASFYAGMFFMMFGLMNRFEDFRELLHIAHSSFWRP